MYEIGPLPRALTLKRPSGWTAPSQERTSPIPSGVCPSTPVHRIPPSSLSHLRSYTLPLEICRRKATKPIPIKPNYRNRLHSILRGQLGQHPTKEDYLFPT
jgi:hypothetical protein